MISLDGNSDMISPYFSVLFRYDNWYINEALF